MTSGYNNRAYVTTDWHQKVVFFVDRSIAYLESKDDRIEKNRLRSWETYTYVYKLAD